MVTLTGAGGSGKTRLAVEAATARVRECRDGVWLVELAGLSDPGLVADATASVLGLTLPSRLPALEGLGAQLGEWRTLLVLDNCEHLIGACAVLAEHLLGACPGLGILVTSREPLRVPGEVTWRVPSLALPTRSGSLGPAELAGYESIRLFCERASDVAAGFALSEENARSVAEICLRLDGMPLALELAAARVGALSPAQIAERLGDCLAVLTAGSSHTARTTKWTTGRRHLAPALTPRPAAGKEGRALPAAGPRGIAGHEPGGEQLAECSIHREGATQAA